MIDALSERITLLIKKYVKDISEEKAEVINYGLNLALYELFLILIFVPLSILLGMFKYVLISALVYGILRVFAGGPHARSRTECTIVYFTILFGCSLTAKYLWAESIVLSVFIFLINLVILFVYAPGDTEEKPILSKKMRVRLKISSVFLVMVIFILSIVVWKYDKTIYNVIILSTVPVTILLTPIGYSLFKCKHGS